MILRYIAVTAALTLLGACAVPTEPAASKFSKTIGSATANAGTVGGVNAKEQNGPDNNCTFSRGITTCVSTVQYVETTTHAEYSGCRYGPNALPGRRIRTFRDTYLVTATTTTTRRGKSGRVIDSNTVTTRQLLSSTFVSDVCEPL